MPDGDWRPSTVKCADSVFARPPRTNKIILGVIASFSGYKRFFARARFYLLGEERTRYVQNLETARRRRGDLRQRRDDHQHQPAAATKRLEEQKIPQSRPLGIVSRAPEGGSTKPGPEGEPVEQGLLAMKQANPPEATRSVMI
ncbi:hypothetical protein L596_007805 [Steinernema carpocapsae]|uniref:Uncharacterized protein n=1 Tax=Steinernema carpocapsae TaxID=34508 RepID=A0A4U5PAH8_STECR|nr:hypothetical protein L596_007805 [Steinernema carpocapsae]